MVFNHLPIILTKNNLQPPRRLMKENGAIPPFCIGKQKDQKILISCTFFSSNE